jgi:Flp pilus assembly protein TadB
MRNNYGLSHAAVTALVMLMINTAVSPYVAIAGGAMTIFYWYQRERKARIKDGTPKFKDWYPDSQFDVISPLVAGTAVAFFIL